ncbi:MAG: hypothetical protein ABJC61_06260 [Acidobacteriota bacterium]
MMSGFASCVATLFVLAIVGWPLWKIAERLGYPGPMSLLMYVPFVNIIALWYLALNPWPVDRGGMRAGPPAAPLV